MKEITNSFKEMMKEKGIEIPTLTQKEIEQMKVDDFNASAGSLTDYDCPICKNKGFVMKLTYDEFYKDYRSYGCECECMHIRRTLTNAKKSGLGEYLHKKFDDYIASEDWQKNIKNMAMEYVKDDSDSWFIALGQTGAGKTIICSIIANHLLFNDKRKVKYITWTDFISKLKRDMMGDNTDAVSEYLDEIKNVDVLYIDELLKKYNETDLRYIIEIINYRYTNNLKTIISSERLVNELLDLDEATMGRMIEKSGKYIVNIAKDRNKNYRLKSIM